MQLVATALPFIQIGLAILLIASILLQQTGTGIGGAFGAGDNFSSGFHTRRGSEKILFNASIVLSILFALSAFIALII
jgi:protein translocase SecG subunit